MTGATGHERRMRGVLDVRVLVCTKRDLAGAVILNQVLPRLVGDQVLVLLSDKTRPVEKDVAELADIKFLERDFPMDTLFPLIDESDDCDAPLATFKGLERRFGCPIQVIDSINDAAGEDLVRGFNPDVILSARFSLIFRRNIFGIPRFGVYNVHPGALPHYAGLFAPFRCMLDGGAEIGCTLHLVDDGIDTGPILGIGRLPVDWSKSMLWHVDRTYGPGLDLFFNALDGMRRGVAPAMNVQTDDGRAYAGLPGRAAFDAFRAKGLRLFDSAEYLDALRGFMPPGRRFVLEKIAADAAEKVGASCCCAHA